MSQGVCSKEALREAWEQKILFGDRLGTNLLAIGALDEEELVLALGQQHAVHAAFGHFIDPHLDAIRRVPRALAIERMVVPHHVDDGRLWTLFVDPFDNDARRAVEQASGATVVPVVVCEARMWELQYRCFQRSLGMRPIDLNRKSVRPAVSRVAPAFSVEELTAERDFEALYQQAEVNVAAPVERGTSSVPTEITAWADESATPPLPAVVVETRTQSEDSVLVQRWWAPSLDEMDGGAVTPPDDPLPVVRGVVSSPSSARIVNEAALDFDEARAILERAQDRTMIAETVLRYARTHFERAALLAVYPNAVGGWLGVGPGMGFDELGGYRVALSERSVFQLVVESRAHYLGPLQTWSAHAQLVKQTGRQIPLSIAVFPVLVRGRVVNLLYGDNGHGKHTSNDVGPLLILARWIADSYEALLGQAASTSP